MLTFVVFSLKRAWQGFWRNALMSIAATATMVLMLMLLAGFWILRTGLQAGLDYTESKVEVVADLKDKTKPDEVEAHHGPPRAAAGGRLGPLRQQGGGPRQLPGLARGTGRGRLHEIPRRQSAARQPRGQARRCEHLRQRRRAPPGGAGRRPGQGATDDRRQPPDGHQRPAAPRAPSSCSSSRSSSCSSSSTRFGWPSSRGPRRSRSCAWSGRRTPSSAGRSCSRGRWSGCSGRR